MAEERARALKEGTQAGANSLRRTIRRQPVVAIGIATVAGALLALAVVPRIARGRNRSRWEAWAPHVTRADLYDVADNIQRSLARATSATTAPVASSLERLVDAFSKMNSRNPSTSCFRRRGPGSNGHGRPGLDILGVTSIALSGCAHGLPP